MRLRAALLTIAAIAIADPAPAETPPAAADLWQRDAVTGDWGGLRTRLGDAGVTLSIQEQSEGWANLAGGLKQGAAYVGLFTVGLAVDLEKAVGWSGASFLVNGFQVHGLGPTPLLVGSLQAISGIEATPGAKLYDLWLEQQLWGGKLALRFGQEGANDEFMLAQSALLFINSSFGFPPSLALDLPSGGPNYPLATPFARVKYQPSDEFTLMAAIYNGDPAPPGTGDPQLRDRYGTAFRLNDHSISFAELWYAPSGLAARGLPGTYKFGAWYNTGRFPDQLHDTLGLSLADPASTGLPRQHAGDWGAYAVIDQMVWKKPGAEGQGVSLFLQLMGTPADRNPSDLSIAGGVAVKGTFPGRADDQAGLAVTFVGIGASARRLADDVIRFTGTGFAVARGETIIEATYQASLAPWLKLQPDVQYVINPGAGIPTDKSPLPLKNDWIVGLRATVNF
jgi:porin